MNTNRKLFNYGIQIVIKVINVLLRQIVFNVKNVRILCDSNIKVRVETDGPSFGA